MQIFFFWLDYQDVLIITASYDFMYKPSTHLHIVVER